MLSEVDVRESKFSESRSATDDLEVDLLTETAASPSSTSVQPTTDFEILEKSIGSVSAMLDRVLAYVRAVIAGEIKGDAAVGKYLMDMLGASTEDLEKGGFNASLQVCTTVLQRCASLTPLP